MKKYFCFLLLSMWCCSLSAQTIWHQPDSLIPLPLADSISPTEEYTVLAVIKSLEPDTPQLFWGVKANDTLQSAFMTNAYYTVRSGVYEAARQRDYSRWSILYYHTGCIMDTAKSYSLWLGATAIPRADSASSADSLPANIEIKELFYTPCSLTRREAAAWQTYLALKYGITLDYASYISQGGDTLWFAEDDYAFYHRIVGIGRDSLHLWSAAESSSLENASLKLVCSGTLLEGEYVLLGDDDQEEGWSLQASGYNRLLRTWRMRSRLRTTHSCSLVWTPSSEITAPDSVWLVQSGADGEILARSCADSIVGDTAWWFTLAELPPMSQLTVETLAEPPANLIPDAVMYDASSGTIILSGLDPDKIYSYALYTHLGHLLFRPAPSRPDGIHVGALPKGIYRLEAFDDGAMAASVAVIVN